MELYLNTYGTYLHKVGEVFEIKMEGKKVKISPKKIKSIVITNGSYLSSDAISLAVKNNIDIVILDSYGDVVGRFWHSKFGSTAYIRRKQLEFFEGTRGFIYAKNIIIQKVNSIINHLNKLKNNRKSKKDYFDCEISKIELFLNKIKVLEGEVEEKRDILMAYEGNISRIYYKIIEEIIPKEFKFKGRSYRPAKDEYNCMLNYGFGIIYNRVEKALIISGLDPFIGILHTDNYGKKSLIFDVIELFRCYVLEVVFKLFSQKKVNKNYFDKIYGGVRLNKEGKKILAENLIKYLSEKVIYNNRRLERSQIIQVFCHRLANSLIDNKEELNVSLFSL